MPNPLAILSISNSLDWKKLAVSVVYSAVDSYTSYKNATENVVSCKFGIINKKLFYFCQICAIIFFEYAGLEVIR